VFQGRSNIEDVGFIRRYEDLLRIGKPVRLAIGLFVVIVSILGFVGIGVQGAHPVVIGILVALFYLVFILPRDRVWAARRFYRRHADSYNESRVMLTPDWVHLENVTHRSDYSWSLLGLVCDTPEGLMFCNQANQCLFWLPQRLFEGNDLRERILELVASKDVLIQKLS